MKLLVISLTEFTKDDFDQSKLIKTYTLSLFFFSCTTSRTAEIYLFVNYVYTRCTAIIYPAGCSFAAGDFVASHERSFHSSFQSLSLHFRGCLRCADLMGCLFSVARLVQNNMSIQHVGTYSLLSFLSIRSAD